MPSSPLRTARSSTASVPYRTGLGGLAVTLLLVAVSSRSLSAQQQNWPPDDAYAANPDAGTPPPYPAQPNGYGAQQQYSQPAYQSPQQPYSPAYPQQGYGQKLAQAQPISPDQLTQLVAPIALYPDALVAQILAASTYPAQLAAADQWLRSLGNPSPEQIAAGADAQSSWDPSVKALTAFPQVLGMLNQNLQWTTALGNAYYNQPQDVLQTIQVMRERAEDAGNLQSTPQEQVTENQGAIDIAPTNPQVVYVPTYNPWSVYGQPVNPYPGFSLFGALGSFLGSSPVQFGLSFAMNAFLHSPWGFLGWGLDWLAHSILFNHSSYVSQSRSVADWGFPHGGPRAYPGSAQFAHSGYGIERGSNNPGWGNPGWGNPGRGNSGWARNGYAPRYGSGVDTNRGYNQGLERYGDARSAEGFNRGFAPPARLPQEAYNRYPQAFGRPQQFGNEYAQRGQTYAGRPDSFGRSGYGSGFSGAHDGYAGRSGYASPSPAYRMPENSYRASTGRASDAYRGNEFSSAQRGGFHLFGGGHSSSNFSGGGWKAPKESHFGGGGSHFSPGRNSGGGHSHSSGGHSGRHR